KSVFAEGHPPEKHALAIFGQGADLEVVAAEIAVQLAHGRPAREYRARDDSILDGFELAVDELVDVGALARAKQARVVDRRGGQREDPRYVELPGGEEGADRDDVLVVEVPNDAGAAGRRQGVNVKATGTRGMRSREFLDGDAPRGSGADLAPRALAQVGLAFRQLCQEGQAALELGTRVGEDDVGV